MACDVRIHPPWFLVSFIFYFHLSNFHSWSASVTKMDSRTQWKSTNRDTFLGNNISHLWKKRSSSKVPFRKGYVSDQEGRKRWFIQRFASLGGLCFLEWAIPLKNALPETNSSPLKIGWAPKGNSYSNHVFSGRAVSFRECMFFFGKEKLWEADILGCSNQMSQPRLRGPAKSLQVAKMSYENKLTRNPAWQFVVHCRNPFFGVALLETN